jgi:hypothetical protein
MQQNNTQKINNLFRASNFFPNLVLLGYKHFQQINNGGIFL